MTIFSWIGIGLFLVMFIVGCVLKSFTRKRVMGLEGMKGIISKDEEQRNGGVIVKVGD